ncbi:MAG: 5-formyltetrahydrofolate cyclo-ligase [Gammaproteobacteria bacterium]|nr:5-formyltetrahydrofolate cyclo-ligase [Gammaproteobacteria bacterium]
MSRKSYPSKAAARQAVWDALQHERVARFPFPPHGRIPNFAGADAAAERLLALPLFEGARAIKVSPDAPQHPVRERALARGITVYVPAPRLRGGFYRLDPRRIPAEARRTAAGLARGRRWAEATPLDALPVMDVVVTGSVAVTSDGRRCGKGHGYGDIEYAILRELGHPPVPVATTVHRLQRVTGFPADPHDLPVAWIVTPEEVTEVADPPAPPDGIDWAALPAGAFQAMPVLGELHRKPPPDGSSKRFQS